MPQEENLSKLHRNEKAGTVQLQEEAAQEDLTKECKSLTGGLD